MSEQKKNYSIHPRNWYKVDSEFTRGKKSNTSKSRSVDGARTAAHHRHTIEHPRDTASANHLSARLSQ